MGNGAIDYPKLKIEALSYDVFDRLPSIVRTAMRNGRYELNVRAAAFDRCWADPEKYVEFLNDYQDKIYHSTEEYKHGKENDVQN